MNKREYSFVDGFNAGVALDQSTFDCETRGSLRSLSITVGA
jgi:hypothetical protein